MSAREELYAAVMDGGYHSPARSERASRLIDAFQAQVLREAAEKLRKQRDDGHDETKCVPCFMYGHAADLIDPDKEN